MVKSLFALIQLDELTLTLGGNDVGLIDVLNQCVFQYGVFNWDQVTVAEVAAKYDEKYKWASEIDFEKLGRGCPGQLGISSNLIDSTSFSNQIDKVLNAAKAKLASGLVKMFIHLPLWLRQYTNMCLCII